MAGAEGRRVQVRIPEERADQARRLARLIAREPFQKRSWAELGFFLASSALACAGEFFLAGLGIAGIVLAVVLVGVIVLAGALRAARGLGRWEPNPSRSLPVRVCSGGCGRHSATGPLGGRWGTSWPRCRSRSLAYGSP